MSKIGGRPPQAPLDIKQAPAAHASEPLAQAPADPTPAHVEHETQDIFERRAALGAALAGHPAATGTKSGRPPKFNFTNQDIEYLNTFFAALREQPQASRKKRAQMLVSSILKNKHLAGLLANLSEPERESMCDAIAEALDTSPRYAQLVDRLSEGPTS